MKHILQNSMDDIEFLSDSDDKIIRSFPKRTRHDDLYYDDLYYDELDPINKNVVLRHLKIAGKIIMWDNIRTFLGDQIHKKKCRITKTQSYYPVTSIAKRYYKNYIHFGKRMIAS